jgi:WD40 repeat protein
VSTGNFLKTLEGHHSEIISVDYSPDGTRLVSGSNDTTIRLWETATGEYMGMLKGHGGWVNAVVFNSDGTQVASASGDTTVRLWDFNSIGQVANSRRAARAESMQLVPLVQGWLKNTDGNSKHLLSVIQSDFKNRQPEEQAILRNLVLKQLYERNSSD